MSKKTKVVKAEEKKIEQTLATVQTPEAPEKIDPPEPPKEPKLDCNRFVGLYLIKNVAASEAMVKEALAEAGIRKSQAVIDAWMGDWKWMLPAFEAAGWKRPTNV